MAGSQLNFSTGSLLGKALMASLFASAFVAITLDILSHGRSPGFAVFRLLGPEGTRIFLVAGSVLVCICALALWRRLLGDRVAAAIRDGGIELRGLFMSRIIPWRSLDRLHLRSYRLRGDSGYFITAESRCPPGASAIHHALASLSYGLSTALIEGCDEDAARWVEQANRARADALRSPAHSLARRQAPGPGHRGGFGRRDV